ncbi:MAG: ATP-binding protein [Bdellovibrionota bacterium]
MIDPNEKNERIQSLSEKDIEAGLFHSVRKLLHTMGQKPLCLVLDDVHWAGDLSIKMLEYIVDGLDETKISLILFHRPDYVPSFYRQLNYNELHLKP